MDYTVTIGKSSEERRNRLIMEEDPELIDSLVILLDRLFDYLPIDDDLMKGIFTVLSRETRMEFISECNELLDEEDRIDPGRIKSASPGRTAGLLNEAFGGKEREKGEKVLALAKEIFYRNFGGKKLKDSLRRRASALNEIFDISETEAALLSWLFLVEVTPGLDDASSSNRLPEFQSLTAAVLDLPLKEVRRGLSEKGNLIRLGLVEPDFLPPPHFQVDDAVKRYFRSGSLSVFLDNLRPVEGNVYPLDSFPVSAQQSETVMGLLKTDSRTQILLYGTPGTGKTEFARALVRQSGCKGYFLTSVDEGATQNRNSRILNLQAISRKLDPENSVLVVDEADHLLNSETLFSSESEKGWITDFIDNSPVRIIWISNSVDETHRAVLRRFTYSLRFRPSSSRSRESTWNTLVKKSPLGTVLDASTIRRFSREYRVNVGGIASALNAAARVYETGSLSRQDLVKRLQEILSRHQELVGAENETHLKPLSPSYDPSVLNTDVDLGDVRKTVAGYGKNAGAASLRSPLTMLFWGLPGTGKTEFAKYLAEYVDRPLHVKRVSSLMSKWVGETESNIDRAFRHAESEGAVLLLDEADSFFISRGEGRQQWEVSQTNELLTQMENFEGILICSTNLLDALDHAVMRRFTFKVQFRPPKADDLLSLYRQVFRHVQEEPTEEQLQRLRKMAGLTPGDLFTVQSRFSVMGVADASGAQEGKESGERDDEMSLHEEILAALELELSYKRDRERQIGFVG